MQGLPALGAAAAIGRAFRLRPGQIGVIGPQIIQSLTSLTLGAKALKGIGQPHKCLGRTRTLPVPVIGFVIGERGILEIPLAHQRIAQQQGRILRPRAGAVADRFPRGSFGSREIALRQSGAAIRNRLINGSRGVGGCRIGRGWLGLRRLPRLRRARGGRSASTFLQRVQAEIHIAAQLVQIAAQLPVIVFGNIKLATQTPAFFLKLLHSAQQLLHQIARRGRTARRSAWRWQGTATGSAQAVNFAPQIQDLVLQRNAFPAFHLGVNRRGQHQAKTHKRQAKAGKRI